MKNQIRNSLRKKALVANIRVLDPLKVIIVQLDARTRVTVKDMKAFDLWHDSYPGAKILANNPNIGIGELISSR